MSQTVRLEQWMRTQGAALARLSRLVTDSARGYDRQQAWRHLRALRTWLILDNVKHLSALSLIMAVTLAIYKRWVYSGELSLLILPICVGVALLAAYALTLKFKLGDLTWRVSRLWIGCLVGVISFTEFSPLRDSGMEICANVLFVLSMLLQTLWTILDCTNPANSWSVIRETEVLELVGFSAAACVVGEDALPLLALIAAFTVTMLAIRLRSFYGLVNVAFLALISGLFFIPALRVRLLVNPVWLGGFSAALLVRPMTEYVLGGQTALECWLHVLRMPGLARHLLVLAVTIIDIAYLAVCSATIPEHKEWYIVILMFGACAAFWLCYHTLFIVTLWQLMKKITNCNMTFRYANDMSKNMAQIMASEGIRHFALISSRVTMVTALSTLLVALVSWETRTALTLSLLVLVIPLEGAILSLLRTMGAVLGGRCIAYAMVAPAVMQRHDAGVVTLFSESLVKESGGRALFIIGLLEKFFSQHMVHIFACDYSTTGLTMETVQTRVKSFFEKNTEDGPRYDTYLLYYSGHTYDNGDWALAGNARIKLDQLLTWWDERNASTGARLVLLLDAEHSWRWLRPVQKTRHSMIAVQTYCLNRSPNLDPEINCHVLMGDFTREFVLSNCRTPDDDTQYWTEDKLFLPAYTVSKAWTDFTFHLPTDDDIIRHWTSNFPSVTLPLVKCMSCACVPDCSILYCCSCLVRCLRRKRMIWFPPKQLDTKHGFLLVRR